MSSGDRARAALALFDEWVDLPLTQRQRHLAELAASDPALHAEVKALLDADAAEGLLERDADAVLASLATAPAEEFARQRIGAWQVTGIIGSGGMGVVYRGERVEGGFQQLAAIKRIRIGMDHPDLRKRFLRERQMLARLRHPNIAALLDGGVDEHGSPYFAMELVQGERITAWCDARRLDVRGRVRLFLQVLDAVAFAHRQLVVHRDLKPSNILVDANGKAFLLDFGIAKLIEGENDDGHTRTSERAFTPEYASPEQLLGEPISTATDLYQLGVLLYALLAQSHPYGLTGDTPLRVRITHMDSTPQPLWEAARKGLSEDAARRDSTPTQLASQLRGDLTAITQRLLASDPKQRYDSVDALRSDLIAWLDGRAVSAHAPSFRYRAGRFLRRHAIASAAATVAVLALIAGASVSLWQAGIAKEQAARALQQRRIAVQQAQLARMQADSTLAVQELMTGMFSYSLAVDGGRSTTVRDLVDNVRRMSERKDTLSDPARAQLLLNLLRIGAVSDAAEERALQAELKPLIAASGPARPRLLAQLLDVQLEAASGRHDLAQMQRLAPPLLRLLETLPQPLDEDMLQVKLRTLRTWSWTLDQTGRFDEAIASKRHALDAVIARYGKTHRRTRLAQGSYARALTQTGQSAQAVELLREVLQGEQADASSSAMDQISTTISLAEALRKTGAGKGESLRLLQSAEATARARQAELLPFFLPWLQALQADILREQGKLTEASTLLQQAATFDPMGHVAGLPPQRNAVGVRVVVLTTQSDLAWAQHDAAASARFARQALALLGTLDRNDFGDRKRTKELQMRLQRTERTMTEPTRLPAP